MELKLKIYRVAWNDLMHRVSLQITKLRDLRAMRENIIRCLQEVLRYVLVPLISKLELYLIVRLHLQISFRILRTWT